ncbi:MAG: Z1 domain-containing protein [Bacteroidales bacterium]|nr:Z1 domain-containing protein [Bacteroidales bacterium]
MDSFQKAIEVCRTLIGLKTSVSDEDIDIAVNQVVLMFPSIDKVILKTRLMAIYNVRVEPMQILEGRERRKPWIMAFRASQSCNWLFWNRYKYYLEHQKGFAPATIQGVDDMTDKILDRFFNPQITDIILHKKGLVVGQVQSGKTANYTGLICKAADAGFNLIIVLAGMYNNLRSQTQLRLDEGFLGFDTQFERTSTKETTKIGVGLIHGYERAIANSYTTNSEKGDFTNRSANTAGFNFNAPQPALLVVKKNSTVLKRLNTWLNTYSENGKINNKTLLMVDDEADNASINTNISNEDPTTINKYICSILNKFNRTAYVGYTATPFANIFIPQDDSNLFPRDFIINLPSPSSYIGPDKVFGTSLIPDDPNDELLPIVSTINDFSSFVPNKHKKDDVKPSINDIPESLKRAIKCFIITCAIRIVRGQEHCHNSMLIHVSRFQSWQNHITDLVTAIFNYYKQEIESNDEMVFEELRQIFEVDTNEYKSYKTITSIIQNSKFKDIDDLLKVHDWQEIKSQLFKAVQKITVKAINGSSKDALTYYDNKEEGISVIAIGGDKLSRGLTLEGLSISYFLRASKMYDTLMQMGRWFGYRHGYVDLCRLFTSSELNEWYRHISLASEELREEFSYLYEVGGTPEDYALRVRNHPGVLQITSLSKMRNASTVEVSWAGRLVETYQLLKDRNNRHSNFVAADRLLCGLGDFELKGNNYLWRNVTVNKVLSFFDSYRLPSSMVKVNLRAISEYVKQVNSSGELSDWNVVLMNKPNGEKPEDYDGYLSNGLGLNYFLRVPSIDSTEHYLLRKNHILGNPRDEFIDIDEETLRSALEETNKKLKNRNQSYPSPKLVRERYRDVKHPLLIIYPIKPSTNYVTAKVDGNEPYMSFAISFPHTNTGVAVSYSVNQLSDFADTEDIFESENDNVYER